MRWSWPISALPADHAVEPGVLDHVAHQPAIGVPRAEAEEALMHGRDVGDPAVAIDHRHGVEGIAHQMIDDVVGEVDRGDELEHGLGAGLADHQQLGLGQRADEHHELPTVRLHGAQPMFARFLHPRRIRGQTLQPGIGAQTGCEENFRTAAQTGTCIAQEQLHCEAPPCR